MFTFEIVSTRARFEQLETDWNDLAGHLGNPLLRHEWFVECARAFTPDAELAIHVVRQGERIRAAAPLVFKRTGPVTRLQMIGAENYEPEAFLHDGPEALDALCGALAALHRPVALLRLGAAAPELTLLRQHWRGRGLPLLRPGSTRTYFTPIAVPDWKAFAGGMSSGRRKELERKRRKLEQLGPVTFEVLAPTPDVFETPFREFVALEGAGWKGRNGTAIDQDPPALGFYDRYGRNLAGRGMLRLFFLRLNGRAVAAQYHIQYGGKLWELKIAYDEAHGRHSPGALLTHEILRYACEQGLTGLDHLGEAEEWQTRWPVQEKMHSSLRFYPASPRGAAALGADGFSILRKRLGRPAAVPPPEASPADAAAASPPSRTAPEPVLQMQKVA